MKKIIMLSLFTYTLSFTNAAAQGTWSPRTSFPSSRYCSVGFSVGNYGYMGLGIRGVTYYKDFWQFDPATNTWERKADFPGLARVWPATFVIGNKAYVVTGQDTNYDCVQECWQYDPSSNTWTQKANFPGAARAYDVGFAIGGKGYVGTGSQYNFDFRNDFWAYDTGTDSWSQIASLPATPRFCSNGFALNGQGYIFFGADSSYVTYQEVWAYDTGSNTWTRKNNYPGLSNYSASGFVIGSFIYVGGGYEAALASTSIRTFWQYNPSLDSWVQEAGILGIPSGGCSAFSISDTGYLGLGFDSAGFYLNTMYRFIPDTTTTGINQLSIDGDNILIYPNPTNKELHILLNKQLSGLITLWDIAGRELMSSVMNFKEMQIDVSWLSPGMYFLSVKTTDTSVTKKFIKQ